MLIAGCNFSLHIVALNQFPKKAVLSTYWHDPEFKFFVWVQIFFICAMSLGLYFSYSNYSLWESFTKGSLQLSSMAMNSGYTIFDMDKLPASLSMLLIFASILGGCAGSTTGGLKMIRVLVLWLQGKRELGSFLSHQLLNLHNHQE